MKNLFIPIIIILSTLSVQAQVDTLMFNGDSDEHINIVILGDGYRSVDHAADLLITDATNFMNAMLAESPFQEYSNFFNFFIITRNSIDDLADHPENAADENQEVPPCPMNTSNTRYNTSFDLFSIHRLLGPDMTGETQAFIDLVNYFPHYDQAIMLVNDPCYGGSGGTIAVSSTHVDANEIAIHELAHSYADLKDEYYVNDQLAEEESNMTMNTNPATVKWNDWMGINGIGIYQHTCPLRDMNGIVDPNLCYADSDYDEFDQWYKPHQNCKMQFLGSDFCSVCKETLIDKMYLLVDPFQDKIPNLTSLFAFNGSMTTFGSNLILPNPNTYVLQWELNGNIAGGRTNSMEVWTYEDFKPGVNVLKLRIIDQTTLSKSYLPGNGYVFELTWNVNKVDLCTANISTFPYTNSFPPGSENGQTTGDDFDWSLGNGPTPSANTGPNAAYDGSTYLFLEATGNFPNQNAILYSECFDLTALNNPKMSIAVHSFGNATGTLNIEFSPAAGNNGTYTNVFSITGVNDPNWKEHEFDLTPFISPYTTIKIEGITGNNFAGDIAIDYLRIYEGCASTLTLNQNHTGTNTYKAENSITSTSNVLSGNTTYQSSTINLNNGFNVNTGAIFKTQNGGCN